jgi:hypothetical protein
MTALIITTALMLQEAASEGNSSGAIGTFVWIGVIAVVMICLIILGLYGLSARDKTKT